MKSGPPFLPEEIANIHTLCPKCGAVVRPNFWKECDFPFTPIYPKGTRGEKGGWIQVGTSSNCTCGIRIDFPIDAKRLKYPLFFYGDDADRHLDDYFLHSYSMIGGTSGPINEMCEDLRKLKKKYLPTVSPDSWRIHTTKMMNAKKRITHSIYKQFNRDSLCHFFADCANILKTRDQMTWNHHVTAVISTPNKKKAAHFTAAKATAHNALLSYSIYSATKQELRPVYMFDANKPVKHFPHIEGWSFDTYNASRRYLAHAYITHSNDIKHPEFAKPGSHPCLELADIHAYFAARTMYDRFRGVEPELSLNNFGTFRYLTVKHGERIEFKTGSDIPRDYAPIR